MADEVTGWPSSADAYQLTSRIGQGAFSEVWKARCLPKNVPVAVKVMDLENINSTFEDITQEVQMMRLSDHPNILRCYSSFVAVSQQTRNVYRDHVVSIKQLAAALSVEGLDRQLWLVIQMMEKGSCLHVMTQSKRMGKGEGLKEDWIAYILKETLQGLKYFHDNGHIHRDVKAGNILLDGRGNVRIADFGVSGWLINFGDRRQCTKTFVGTPCWMAPEVMEQLEGYDYKADIWSFGITALELAKGYAPYAHYAPMKVLIMTIQNEPPSLKSYPDGEKSVDGDSFSRGFRELIRLCLQKDPKKRPNCSTLLNKSYFKGRNRDSMVSELLDRLESVGEGADVESAPRLPGTQLAYIAHDGDATVKVGGAAAVAKGGMELRESSGEFVRGTTWVFEDGSQVILRADAAAGEGAKEDDSSFYDEFEKTTKGEDA